MDLLGEVLNVVAQHDSGLAVRLREYVKRRKEEESKVSTKDEVLQALLDTSFSHLDVATMEGTSALLRKETVRALINKGVVRPIFSPDDGVYPWSVTLQCYRFENRDVLGSMKDLAMHIDHLLYMSRGHMKAALQDRVYDRVGPWAWRK